jgi:hypothetical protein
MQNSELSAVETIIAKFHSGAVSLLDAQRSLRDAMALDRVNGHSRALEEFSPISVGTIGDRYRFRAECHRDAELFIFSILWFIEPSWTILPLTYYPDVEVKFSIRKEISPRDLLWAASSIIDGHVLVQTLEKEDRYTGKRDYERELDVHEPDYKPSADVLRDMKKGAAHHIKSLKHLLAEAREFAENLKAISR